MSDEGTHPSESNTAPLVSDFDPNRTVLSEQNPADGEEPFPVLLENLDGLDHESIHSELDTEHQPEPDAQANYSFLDTTFE